MQFIDRLKTRFGWSDRGLAMAGKNNPWGNRGGGSDDDNTPTGDKPDGGGDGPRNPWLPGGGKGGSGGDEPRRSASIEDIFKNRGPEGPRRGGGPGGPNIRLPDLPSGKSWGPLIIAGAVILWFLATGVHLVEAKEKAVVKTFGSYSHTFDPGLNFTFPFPIQTVDVEDVQTVRRDLVPSTGESAKLILTGDQNLVDLNYVVRWNIKDLENFKFELADPVETVKEVAEAAMRASVAQKTLDATFTGEGRAEIQLQVRERMQATLDEYQAGINVLGVEIERADPPSEVVDAFRDVSVAEQNADRARNQAQGYAQQVLATAEGEAEAFDKVYEQYRLAPEVTRQRLYYETMERVLAKTDKTIVEAEGVTPYLPLPEIRKRAQAAPAEAAATPQAQTGGQ
ncbi:protease modulator HflK [Erythrobacter sp. YT30]|uniref:protease modulator HflK n=1 Tax=Erythrobacter sp. YT30 TaxID=1735012 RepID=UPI000A4505FC|nr:protease modulator HflK [Erythrobacter sp. YT30]